MQYKLKQKEYIKHKNNHSTITNPITFGQKEYKDLQVLANRKVIIDRIMFIILGVFAILAFYVSLMSLML